MILVAENLTVADPVVERAIRDRDPEPIRHIARLARRAGAHYLDVNLGRGRRGRDAVEFALEALLDHWVGGILVDSSDPGTMERALTSWQGPVVLNGYSGDPGREGILDLAVRHGSALVVFLMARGIPKAVDQRLALAAELIRNCSERGIEAARLWIDPVVAPLGWAEGQEYDAALIEVLRRLPDLLGEPVQSIVGLSNLTTAATHGARVPWLQEVFLAAAWGAGLTHVMLDIRNANLIRTAHALDVLAGRKLFAPQEFNPG